MQNVLIRWFAVGLTIALIQGTRPSAARAQQAQQREQAQQIEQTPQTLQTLQGQQEETSATRPVERSPAASEAGDVAIRRYTSEPQGFIREPDAITRAAIFSQRHVGNGDRINGLRAETWSMVPGAGWISVGPGYRRWFNADRAFFDTSAAVSWRGYKVAQGQFELPKLLRSRLALGAQGRWQDLMQVGFFGTGPDTTTVGRSEYRLRSTDVVGYATVRLLEWAAISAEVGWLKPSILDRAGLFLTKRPDTRTVMPHDLVYTLPEQPAFRHSKVSIAADKRDFPGHPTRGGLLYASATDYFDLGAGIFSFRQYEGRAAAFVPIAGGRVVLAFNGMGITTDARSGHQVPFYLLPGIGGRNTVRSYADYRFHDRNVLFGTGEVRVAMMTHLDVAVFMDAGGVAARFNDIALDKRSYGAGLRLHSRTVTFASLDAAHGREGWRLAFRMNDPLNLGALTRRTASVPFVP